MKECLKAALKWWHEEASSLTQSVGDGDWDNVFDDDPMWVVEARKLLSEDEDKDDDPTSNPVLLSSAIATLFHTDAELLSKSPSAMVRQELVDDIAVKDLYEIYKSL
jgi:hypothetical protein